MADPQALHAELLGKIVGKHHGEIMGCGECGQNHEATAALSYTLEVHEPVRDPTFGTICVECSTISGDLERISSYPCRTVRVIASALGVTTDG
jgi:hypothetical protein